MKAMILRANTIITDDSQPLSYETWPDPVAGPGDVVVRISACGVCHTEMDEIEGRASPPNLPIIPGHQIVGRVEALGANVSGVAIGDRVGIAWIYSACGHCDFCRTGQENLCAGFRATGRDANGGYAERAKAPADFVHAIPESFSDTEAAPLLCAGAVGYRALRLAGITDGQNLGFMGFGASAHLVLQLARQRYPRSRFYVFARNETERALARQLGADWTGNIVDMPPRALHAMIDTTPAWTPVVEAMKVLAPGGRLIINAIRKEDTDKAALTRFHYGRDLWMEKDIKSVANVTRQDVREFLLWAAEIGISPEVTIYSLRDANRALADMKAGRSAGAKVLIMI